MWMLNSKIISYWHYTCFIWVNRGFTSIQVGYFFPSASMGKSFPCNLGYDLSILITYIFSVYFPG